MSTLSTPEFADVFAAPEGPLQGPSDYDDVLTCGPVVAGEACPLRPYIAPDSSAVRMCLDVAKFFDKKLELERIALLALSQAIYLDWADKELNSAFSGILDQEGAEWQIIAGDAIRTLHMRHPDIYRLQPALEQVFLENEAHYPSRDPS